MYFWIGLLIGIIIILFLIGYFLCEPAFDQQLVVYEQSETFASLPRIDLSIISDDSQILLYCQKWNIPINNYSSQYKFYILDEITNLRLDYDIKPLICLMGEAQRLYFNNKKSYITNGNDKSCTNVNLSRTKVLWTGFPLYKNNDIILDSKYMDHFLNSSTVYYYKHIIMPKCIPPKIVKPRKIPRIIYQSFTTHAIPESMSYASRTWVDLNPDYEYNYYDDFISRKFIAENFADKVVQMYDRLIPGAYKCDLWRICMLYIRGGVYIDIKMGCNIPLDDYITDDTDIILVQDVPDRYVYNAFMAAAPKCDVIKRILDKIIYNIDNRIYGLSPCYTTGPIAVHEAVKYLFANQTRFQAGTYHIQGYNIQIFKINKGHIETETGVPIISRRHNNEVKGYSFLTAITGLERYVYLWLYRRIFN